MKTKTRISGGTWDYFLTDCDPPAWPVFPVPSALVRAALAGRR